MAYFVADLLWQVVVSLTISFFVDFRVNISDSKIRFIRVIDQIMFDNMLKI